MINDCDGLCSICKYRTTPIDGAYCGPCDNDFDNFTPDWVGLISTHFQVSRNKAKKMYHNMLEDFRIIKNAEKITNDTDMKRLHDMLTGGSSD